MLAIILTVVIVLAVLVLSEIWWRFKHPNDELSRKAVHILVGCFVAFWPYYLSWRKIELLGLAFLVVAFLAMHFNFFKSINSVQRTTYGQLFFALSVTLVALITHDKLIYMTSILSMGLADGLAGIVGSYFGKSTNYRVFGHTKSIVGSLTFYVAFLLILVNFNLHTHSPNAGINYLILALVATVLENFSVFGLDNLTVPMLVAIWLAK